MEPGKQAAAVTSSLKASASTSVLLHAPYASQSAFDGGKWLDSALSVASSVLLVLLVLLVPWVRSMLCFAGTNLWCGGDITVGPDKSRLRAAGNAGIAGICWGWGCWVDPWQRVRVRVRRERATLEFGSQHQQRMSMSMRQQFEICRQSAEEGSQSEPTTAAAPRQATGEQVGDTRTGEQTGRTDVFFTGNVGGFDGFDGSWGGFGNKKELLSVSAVPRGNRNWNWNWNCRRGGSVRLQQRAAAHTLSAHGRWSPWVLGLGSWTLVLCVFQESIHHPSSPSPP